MVQRASVASTSIATAMLFAAAIAGTTLLAAIIADAMLFAAAALAASSITTFRGMQVCAERQVPIHLLHAPLPSKLCPVHSAPAQPPSSTADVSPSACSAADVSPSACGTSRSARDTCVSARKRVRGRAQRVVPFACERVLLQRACGSDARWHMALLLSEHPQRRRAPLCFRKRLLLSA